MVPQKKKRRKKKDNEPIEGLGGGLSLQSNHTSSQGFFAERSVGVQENGVKDLAAKILLEI